MPRGHAADPQASGNFLFRGNWLPRLEHARTDLREEMLLNLVVERDNAVAVERGEVHQDLQLYRQLGFLVLMRVSVKTFFLMVPIRNPVGKDRTSKTILRRSKCPAIGGGLDIAGWFCLGNAGMAYDLALRQSKISFALHRKRETGLPSFGEKLKQEREKRKITLEQISASTKIGTRMLQALEEDKFNQLPGGIFNKGFVRAYARVIGLDEDQTVAEYLQASGDAPALRTELASLESGEREPNREDRLRENEEKERMSRLEAVADVPPRQLPWGLFAAALLLFALVLSLWSHRQRDRARQMFRPAPTAAAPPSSGETLSSEKSSEKLSGASGSASSSSSAAPQNGATSGGSAPSAAAPGEFTVTIHTRDESWISITADGKTVESELLAAGSERSAAGRKEIIVRVGNAAGVDFRFNGKKLNTAGGDGEVRTVTFGPGGILPNAPAAPSTP